MVHHSLSGKIKEMARFKKRSFLRGVVYEEGKALCQFGSSAVLTFNLKDFKKEVNGLKDLCEKLREHYAFDLKTFHFYRGKGDKVSCYYSENEKI